MNANICRDCACGMLYADWSAFDTDEDEHAEMMERVEALGNGIIDLDEFYEDRFDCSVCEIHSTGHHVFRGPIVRTALFGRVG